jgi:hypothetical protein
MPWVLPLLRSRQQDLNLLQAIDIITGRSDKLQGWYPKRLQRVRFHSVPCSIRAIREGGFRVSSPALVGRQRELLRQLRTIKEIAGSSSMMINAWIGGIAVAMVAALLCCLWRPPDSDEGPGEDGA